MAFGWQSQDGLTQFHAGAILYRTHFWDATVAAEVAKLTTALGHRYDIWVLSYIQPEDDFAVPASIRKISYTERQLRALGLKQRCNCRAGALPLRNLDLPPLHFFRMMPEYKHYWLIEYDVRYSGEWAKLFAELDDPAVDFMGTALQRRPENPEWQHWANLCTGDESLDPQDQVKSFTPLIRLSRRAFTAVDDAYRRGWHGHYEALWPTAIATAGLRIEEIGGDGSFTPPHRAGRHYTTSPNDFHLSPGSFAFRPAIAEADIPANAPMLWHPVKPSMAATWAAGAN